MRLTVSELIIGVLLSFFGVAYVRTADVFGNQVYRGLR
jgi:hypothetical protein